MARHLWRCSQNEPYQRGIFMLVRSSSKQTENLNDRNATDSSLNWLWRCLKSLIWLSCMYIVQLSLPPYLGGKMSLCCILSEKLTSLYQSDWRRETARCWLGRRLHVWSSAHRCGSVLRPGLPACTIPSHAKLKTALFQTFCPYCLGYTESVLLTQYQQVPKELHHTDQISPSTNHYCPILTKYHQYQTVLPHTAPLPPRTKQYCTMITQYH